MEVTGKVTQILQEQSFVSSKNGNTYVRCGFVVETGGQFPKHIAFSVLGKEKYDNFGIVVGKTYNIQFDIDSREWKGRWYVECSPWKVLCMDGDAAASPSSAVQNGVPYTPPVEEKPTVGTNVTANNDDLPF